MKLRFRTFAAGPVFSAQPGQTIDTAALGLTDEQAKAFVAAGAAEDVTPRAIAKPSTVDRPPSTVPETAASPAPARAETAEAPHAQPAAKPGRVPTARKRL